MEMTREIRERLIETASEARRWAYVPYSNYRVGAAVLTESGKIYDGVNIENAAYTPTVCAERVAIFKAVSEGERNFAAVAVVTSNGASPCGVCRQVMAEFGLDTIVLMVREDDRQVSETTLRELLPGAFTPSALQE